MSPIPGNETDRAPETRDRLLRAAGPVFAAEGYDGATVREICASAQVNIASVAYYFGDKLGLYREVIEGIREARDREFPFPENVEGDPQRILLAIVRTILARILSADSEDWESQLVMREMKEPTPAFNEIIREFVRPMFENLIRTMERLIGGKTPRATLEQLVFSIFGQCVYYANSAQLIQFLVPERTRSEHYDIDSLSRHITAVMLAATRGGALLEAISDVDALERTNLHSTTAIDT